MRIDMGDGARMPRLLGAATLVVVGVSALVAWPLSGDLRGAAITPVPGFVRGMVDWLVAVVQAMRAVAPYIAATGPLLLGLHGVAGAVSPRARALNALARVEYAGVEHVAPKGRGRLRSLFAPVRSFFAGTTLAVLAIVLVGATSGIEEEVTNGPLRPVGALLAAAGGDDVVLVLQAPRVTFMDDSVVPADDVERLASSPVGFVPFGKHLFNLGDQSGLQVSLPDDVYAGLAGERVGSCRTASIVVDDTLGLDAGDRLDVNGVPLRVARVEPGIAQMNRSIGILADSTVRECIGAGTSTSYFGLLAQTTDSELVRAELDDAGIDAAVVPLEDFRESNRDFWRANATPLLLQIILYLALFGALAAAGERQSALQRNVREIGILHAGGVDFRALQAVERRRVLHTTYRAALLACPLMVPVAAAFNASELGVQIGVGLTEMSVGVALTLLSMHVASRRALSQFRRGLDLPLAVKG